jgi:predicted  nucleic acid-binding Zn-ribbon protein
VSDNPAAQLAQEIDSLQTKLNDLQQDVRMATVRDEIEDIENKANGLPEKIKKLRGQGYVFENDLESRAADLKERWIAQKPYILQQVDQQSRDLDMEVSPVEVAMHQLSLRRDNVEQAQLYLNSAKSAISTLEGKVEAAKRSIQGMYDSFSSELDKLQARFDKLDWMLTQVAQATFRLLGTEAAVMAVEAIWIKDGKEDKDDPKGIFYLTDQRILFEQKQEIATKKFLFITTETQKVQKLLWESTASLIENVRPTKQGLFKNEDHLELSFGSGAPLRDAHLHLKGQDCNEWQALLGRAKSRDFDQERAIAVDQSAVQKVKSAPSKCPSCGGLITTEVLRGMDSIKCEYCGFVIRL